MGKIVFNWSSGKDSALALHELQADPNGYEVAGLLTVVTRDYDRVSMHGVRRALLERQAQSLGLALEIVSITAGASNDDYEAAMREVLTRFQEGGISTVAFGDIFLEDLKTYREAKLAEMSMSAVFPIWKRDTRELAETFVELGFKAVVTCVDSTCVGQEFAGREFDRAFLRDLPAGVDPCGENGEFHTFCYDGPIFSEPVRVERGPVVLRDNRFYFCDLTAVQASPATSVD